MVFLNESDQQKKLTKFRKKEEEHLARKAASGSDYPYIDLSGIPINTDALKMIPEETARDGQIIAFGKTNKKIRLAVKNVSSEKTQAVIKKLKEGGWEPEIFIASPSSLEKGYSYYDDISDTEKSQAGTVNIANNTVSKFLSSDPSRSEAIELIQDTISGHRDTSRIIEVLVASGIAMKASDIHIETGEGETKLRMRIDGVLQTVTTIPDRIYKLILSRIKLLSGMKLNITEEAQDGRFSIRVNNDDTEIRSSVVPSSYGESVVMRILSKAALDVTLEKLGMQPRFLKLMRREIERPKGLILNTGPTGSGKTTTLYSFLREVNKPGVKTITIENPVEYHLDGIVQTQVEPEEGYDFYDGLKAAMRQDPDIIMVGEIRDSNTAKTALHAGLTGHRVLSTLHTNDAAGTFPRLVELGVDKNLVDSAINVAMAQRLIRKLCNSCKEKVPITGEERDIIKTLTDAIPEPEHYQEALSAEHIYEAKGCKDCNDTGYQGRIGVFEAIIVDEKVGELVQENPSSHDIWEHAQKEQGMLSMAQDGIIKVLSGISDIAELKRVIDLEKSTRRLVM